MRNPRLAEEAQMTDPHAIAKSLSKAQRRYLTTQAHQRDPYGDGRARWMTFPPRNTHDVLMRLGLVDGVGLIRDCGLAVRAVLLEGTENDQ